MQVLHSYGCCRLFWGAATLVDAGSCCLQLRSSDDRVRAVQTALPHLRHAYGPQNEALLIIQPHPAISALVVLWHAALGSGQWRVRHCYCCFKGTRFRH
jgi:hypothetical protein